MPRPASGSCSSRASQSRFLSSTTRAHDRVEQQVRDVVGERAADQELHREVVDALGVLALVGALGAHPALREDVPHGARDGLEALPRTERRGVDDVVEQQMPLVERIVRAGELDRAAAVLLEELIHPWLARCREGLPFLSLAIASPPPTSPPLRSLVCRSPRLTLRNRRDPGSTAGPGGISGAERSVPDPHGGYVAVVAEHAQGAGIQQEMLPAAREAARASAPRARAARGRARTARRRLGAPRARAITRSTRAPTCSGASPPGQPSRKISQSGAAARICLAVRPSYAP